MKNLKSSILVVLILVASMFILAGCGDTIVPDGSTGVVVKDGVALEQYLEPGRRPLEQDGRSEVILVNNKLQNAAFDEPIEGQSNDNVIINAANYSFSYKIGAGKKSVWLVKNVSTNMSNIIPQSLVENALKEALLNLEAEKATNRNYLEPLFKEILQKRIDEYLDYHDGEDTTVITVTYVSIGNLSPEAEYDKELSRTQILLKKYENDRILENANIEANIANAEAQIEQTRLETERLTAGWEQINQKLTPRVMAYLIIEKWDGHCTPGSPLEQFIEHYMNEGLDNNEQAG